MDWRERARKLLQDAFPQIDKVLEREVLIECLEEVLRTVKQGGKEINTQMLIDTSAAVLKRKLEKMPPSDLLIKVTALALVVHKLLDIPLPGGQGKERKKREKKTQKRRK